MTMVMLVSQTPCDVA